jgi:hypothetical protein
MSTLLRPGSALWLLRWDMLHALRNFETSGKGGALRMPRWLGWVVRIFALAALHAVPALIFWGDSHSSKAPSADTALMLSHMLALLGQVTIASMVLMALYSVVSHLMGRQVLDLQLSSPVPQHHLSRARQYQVALSSLIGFPIFILPFANIGPFFGHPGMLWLYPALLGCALIASAVGLAMAGSLIRLFGVRRVKRTINWLAVILLMSSSFAIQLALPHKGDPLAPLSAWESFWAEAMRGGWLPSLGLLAMGLVLVPITDRLVGKLYLEAANAGVERRAKPVGLRFSSWLPLIILRQQWRLMRRNPMMASNLLSPLSMMVFPFIFRQEDPQAGREAGYHMLVTLLGFTAPMTAYSLCWAATALDEAPALMWGAPSDRGRLWRWQLLAALLPTWLVILPPVAMVWWQSPWQGAGLAVVSVAASVAAAILAHARYRPVSRAEAKVHHGYRPGELLAIMAYAGLWAGVASSLNGFGLGLAFLPIALLVPAWALMQGESREYLYD